MDIAFVVKESEKFYVKKIDILGNNITEERVIRDILEVDEGDPYNKLLHAKSINNLKGKNIFQEVKSEIIDTPDTNRYITLGIFLKTIFFVGKIFLLPISETIGNKYKLKPCLLKK